MLVIHVEYRTNPGMRQAFYDAITAEGIDIASRKEQGCLKYDYSFPEHAPDLLLLDEIWTDREAQTIHDQSPHLARLGELKKTYVANTQVDFFDVDLDKVERNLQKKGYKVTFFDTKKEAVEYLNHKIDNKTVGFGGSMTLKELGLGKKLAQHNTVYNHGNVAPGADVNQVMDQATLADIYISSVNGLAETGEMVNIDGRGNRLAGTLYGHDKVYFILGLNKIRPTLEDAIQRARNIAGPKNTMRLGLKNPCSVDGVCHDCSAPTRICSAMVIYFEKMMSCDMEVILIRDLLGY